MSYPLKKIFVDLTPILPGGENGGAKWLVLELIKALAEYTPQTQFVLLIQPAVEPEFRQIQHSNISYVLLDNFYPKKSFMLRAFGYLSRRIPQRFSRLKRIFQRIERLFFRYKTRHVKEKIDADLMFCPFTAPTFCSPKIPTVCVIYDLQHKTYPMFFAGTECDHRDQVFFDACRYATKMITISDYARQSILNHSAIDPERVVTVYPQLANRIRDSLQDDTIIERLGLMRKKYFFYPANYWRHKNHEALLNAFCLVTQNQSFPSDMKLVCSGALESRQRWLQKAAHRMGLRDRVVFAEHLTQSELAALMHHGYAMVFPSLYEGFGLPVAEAMAIDIPVLCSRTRSLPEVAGEAALYFDPRIPTDIAVAMLNIVVDPSLYEQLIQAGKKRVKMFVDPKQMAAEYWQVFLEAYHSKEIIV